MLAQGIFSLPQLVNASVGFLSRSSMTVDSIFFSMFFSMFFSLFVQIVGAYFMIVKGSAISRWVLSLGNLEV